MWGLLFWYVEGGGIIERLRNLSKKVRLFVSIACQSKEERENFLKCLESFSGI